MTSTLKYVVGMLRLMISSLFFHHVFSTLTDGATQTSALPQARTTAVHHVHPNAFRLVESKCTWNTAEDQEYCVFTCPTFAGGRGISILTTPKQAEAISKLPAFAEPEIHRNLGVNQLQSPSFFTTAIKDHGIGVIANRTIMRGEWLMSFTAAFMTPEDVYEELTSSDRRAHQRLAFQGLPNELRVKAEDLDRQGNAVDFFDDIMDTNTFSFPVTTEDETEDWTSETHYKLLFPEISRFNHACRPSADYFFDAETLTLHVVAFRDIFPGEELTISYIDPLQKRRKRVKALKRSWGFDCDCSLCTAAADDSQASDARIEKILELQDELEDRSKNSEATPAKAELLVSLVRQESLWLRMHQSYAAAAFEYSGVGDDRRARVHAGLALAHGFICRGPDGGDDMYRQMEALKNDPRGHPSWMFRLSDR